MWNDTLLTIVWCICLFSYLLFLLLIVWSSGTERHILNPNANTQSLVQVLIKASGHKTEVFVKCLPSVVYVHMFYCGKSSEVLEAQ